MEYGLLSKGSELDLFTLLSTSLARIPCAMTDRSLPSLNYPLKPQEQDNYATN